MAGKELREARLNFSKRKDLTPGQMAAMFNDFADDYDQEVLVDNGYATHGVMHDYLVQHFDQKQRSELKTLDVAAGTGALGYLLKHSGFVYIDALDPAEKMLEAAKSKNIYQRYICDFMDGRRIPGLDTDSYDLLTICGGFNIGLIPLKAFTEIVRVVKPGGLIVFSIAKKFIEDGYSGEFLPLLSRLVEENVWEKIDHLPLEDGMVSIRGSGPGTLFAFQVKLSEMKVSVDLLSPL